MNFNKFLVIVAVVLTLLVGCATRPSESETVDPSPASVSVDQALSTVEPTSASEADVSLDVDASPTIANATPSPQSAAEEITSDEASNNVLVTITPGAGGENVVGTYINTSMDDHYMVVSYAIEEEDTDLSQNMKRIVVTANLGNESTGAVFVGSDALTLIDEAGNRYAPNIYATAEMSPALTETQLDPNEDIYGFVVFDIPSDANSAYLEWCLSGAASCEQPLHAPIP